MGTSAEPAFFSEGEDFKNNVSSVRYLLAGLVLRLEILHCAVELLQHARLLRHPDTQKDTPCSSAASAVAIIHLASFHQLPLLETFK